MGRPREFDEDRVLDAVMETFWLRGYEGTSARELVEATGLGRGSLYAAYASKDGLFEQALLRYHGQVRANVERLASFASPLDGLRDLLTGIVDGDLDGPIRRGCLATNSAIEMAGRDSRIATLVGESFRIITVGIRDAIARGQACGAIRGDRDAENLALLILTTMQGLRVLTRATPGHDRAKLIGVVDQVLATLA